MAKIEESSLRKLHPTQLTVGMIVVKDKKNHLAALSPKDQSEFMRQHAMPAGHRPGRAALRDRSSPSRARGARCGPCNRVLPDRRRPLRLQLERFLKQMEKNHWVHPLDENGVRHLRLASPISSAAWSMTCIVRLPATCATLADTTRCLKPSSSSCGRTSSDAPFPSSSCARIFRRRSRRPGSLRRATTPGTSPGSTVSSDRVSRGQSQSLLGRAIPLRLRCT